MFYFKFCDQNWADQGIVLLKESQTTKNGVPPYLFLFSLHLDRRQHRATDGGAQQDITTKRIPVSLPVTLDFFSQGQSLSSWPSSIGLLELIYSGWLSHYACWPAWQTDIPDQFCRE